MSSCYRSIFDNRGRFSPMWAKQINKSSTKHAPRCINFVNLHKQDTQNYFLYYMCTDLSFSCDSSALQNNQCCPQGVVRLLVCVPVWWGTAKGTWWETAAWPNPCAAQHLETGWGGWWELVVAGGSCWTYAGTSWWTDCWAKTAAGSCWGTPELRGCSERRRVLQGQ